MRLFYLDFIKWFNEKSSCFTFNENSYEVNFELRPTDDYFEELCTEIGQYEDLWGGNNPTPVISMKQVHINRKDIAIQGNNHDSIKFTVNNVACVMFKCRDVVEQVANSSGELVVSFVGKANLNEWYGHVNAQLIIEDIEIEKEDLTGF